MGQVRFAQRVQGAAKVSADAGYFCSDERRSLAVGDTLVIGYDSNQDGATATEAYSHPAHAAFSLNLLHVMVRDESIQGLEPEDFKYRATWHAAASLVSHDLVAKRSGEFLLQGKRITYRAVPSNMFGKN